jgi:hypothetical protein
MAYTTIDLPTDYFNTKLWTGDGNTTQAISGIGHQPDLVWIKNRNLSSAPNLLFDSVRGANKALVANNDNAEASVSGYLNSFDSDGFTVGNDGAVNGSGDTYVSWNWLAGGSASSNSNGSITSNVSASTTSGFSIVSYTGNATNGATVGHGLGAVPDMLIGKDLSDGSGWGVWHTGLSSAVHRLSLSTGGAETSDSFLFGGSGSTLPTSTVFTLGSGGGLNGSNANIVYAFTSIKGFSSFGSYVGNGSTDGTFVYTGFLPAFTIIKRITDATEGWIIQDNKTGTINPIDNFLGANSSNPTSTTTNAHIDYLSNGFKLRHNDTRGNTTGKTYIYMAFAENPFVTSTGIPTTAR